MRKDKGNSKNKPKAQRNKQKNSIRALENRFGRR